MALAASNCCSALAACPSLSVAFPNTIAYNATELSYWSLQESTLTPSCIVNPTSSHQVAEAVSVIVSNDCDFAIKGQGHAPAAGFANIDNGVTIDMTGLKAVTVNDDASVAYIGAGASWLDAYAYLDPLNKTVAGGRNGAVGVGGLTLGGGISYFSPQVGFTCDTVVNFEIVLASGQLVNANSTSHADLYRALKGGMNNFGVVTRFDLATIEYHGILGGSIANNFTDRAAVFEAFAGVANASAYDVYASIVTGIAFNSTSKAWSVSSTPIYTKPELRPAVYEELFSVPNISNTLHITNLSTFANESATPPLNWLFYTATFHVSAELLERIFEVMNSTLYDFEVDPWIIWDPAFEPLPTSFVTPGAGKNVLGTGPEDGNGMTMLLSALWEDSKANERVHAKAVEVMKAIEGEARKMGLLKEHVYANYADSTQKPIQSYGKENVEFLKRTAKKYDPHGVFQKKVPGGFKLDD